jgi:hypothetical protein
MKGDASMTRGNIFWGFVIILVGVLFLLNSTGILKGINPWDFIWPTFLISLGLWILFGNLLGRRTAGEIRQVTIPLEEAASASVKIAHGAGRLSLDSRAAPGELLTGSFTGGVQSTLDRSGSEVKVKLRMPDSAFPFFNWGWSQSIDWKIGLSRDIPLSLEVGTGANESILDLTDLQVTELHLHTGASATKVSLPANAGFTRVICEGGVAGFELRVPSNVAARIRYRGGLSSVNVSTSRFPRLGDVYQSPEYDTAANKVDIDVQMGVGSVEIR